MSQTFDLGPKLCLGPQFREALLRFGGAVGFNELEAELRESVFPSRAWEQGKWGTTSMQIQMQAFGRKPESLRRIIADDLSARPHDVLYLQEFKSPERAPGWSKILGHHLPGAINIKWDAASRMLTARAIAKRGNTPHKLLGEFIAYLIERHGRKVASVNIQLR